MSTSFENVAVESPELQAAALKADQTKTDNEILFGSIDYFTTVFKETNKNAYKLFNTGVIPQVTYGACSHALSPSFRQKLDNLAASTLPNLGWNSCRITALLLFRGFLPSHEVVLKHFQWYISVWASASSSLQDRIRQAWRKLRDTFEATPEAQRWIKVKGPISACICLLFELDFNCFKLP